jgi:retron-type reverse transcriptase
MSLEFGFQYVTKHRGRYGDYVDRYRRAARRALETGQDAAEEFCADLMLYVSDERLLKTALNAAKSHGGSAPGPDGVSLDDIDRERAWLLARRLRDRIRAGTYRRGPLRRCCVPKRPGSAEKRTIYVANVEDRVAAGAAAMVLVPLLEPAIEPHVFSWQGRGTHAALAYAVRQTLDERFTLWITEDLRNAFDTVPRARLHDVLRQQVHNRDFANFVMDLAARPLRRGILQGSPLSPPLLDLHMSHCLHRPWRRDAQRPPLVSYADDLWVGCASGADAKHLYGELERLIRDAGMRPKLGPELAVTDLIKNSVKWLGYRIRLGPDGLRIRSDLFAPSSAERNRLKHAFLIEKFARLHEQRDGWSRPNDVVRGIVSHLGPTLPHENPSRIYQRISEAAAEAGFQEILSFDAVLETWTAAHARWVSRLSSTESQKSHGAPSERLQA